MKRFPLLSAVCVLVALAVSAPAQADPRPTFPVPANAYRPVVQQKIEAVWGVIQRKLDGHNVSPERKKQIRAMLDDAAKGVWAEFNKVAADGSISRQEADHLRDVARGLRASVRARMAAEKRRGTQTDAAKPKERKREPAPSARTNSPSPAPSGSATPPRKAPSSAPHAPPAQPAPHATRPAPAKKPPSATGHAPKHNKTRVHDEPAPEPAPTVMRPPGAEESGE